MNRPAPLAIKFTHCCQDIKQAMQLIYIRLDKNGLRFMGNGLRIKYCPFCGKKVEIEEGGN